MFRKLNLLAYLIFLVTVLLLPIELSVAKQLAVSKDVIAEEVVTSELNGRPSKYSEQESTASKYPEQESTAPKYPVLIFDSDANPEFPNNFRTSHSPYSKETRDAPTREGLDQLNISGSAQFTEKNLKNIVNFLKQNKLSQYICIVDLRQESHGFLDNMPVSWFELLNAENQSRTPQEIKILESKLIDVLKNTKETVVYSRLKSKGIKLEDTFTPYEILYKNALTEEAMVQKHAVKYMRFYIQDHHAPTKVEVEAFLKFMNEIPKNTWLHFHCRAGKGRTTTFMVMVDILRNAEKLPLEVILRRQVLIGGANILTRKKREDGVPVSLSAEREQFIKLFYQYVKDVNGYKHQSWSEWLIRILPLKAE